MASEESWKVKLRLEVDTSEIRSLLETLDGHSHSRHVSPKTIYNDIRSQEFTVQEDDAIKAAVDARTRKPEPKKHHFTYARDAIEESGFEIFICTNCHRIRTESERTAGFAIYEEPCPGKSA